MEGWAVVGIVTPSHFSTLNFCCKSFFSLIPIWSWKLQLKFLTWKVTLSLLAKKPVCFCLPTCFQMKISDHRPSCFPDSKINYIMSRSEGCWKLLMYLLGTLCIPSAFTWMHRCLLLAWPDQQFWMAWAKNHGHILSISVPRCAHSKAHCQVHFYYR